MVVKQGYVHVFAVKHRVTLKCWCCTAVLAPFTVVVVTFLYCSVCEQLRWRVLRKLTDGRSQLSRPNQTQHTQHTGIASISCKTSFFHLKWTWTLSHVDSKFHFHGNRLVLDINIYWSQKADLPSLTRINRHVVSTGPGHLIWPPDHLLWHSADPD